MKKIDNLERMQIIANNITQYRKELGITQKELATRIDIKPSTLSDYINLRSAPSFGVIQKLADFFGVKKSDIDSTFKESKSTPTQPPSELVTAITDKVVQLTTPRQQTVLDVATDQLERQQKEESVVEEDNIIYYPYDYYDHAVSAGTGQYLSDVDVETIELPLDVNADFVVPVEGVSMEPDYHDGDYVFIKLSYNLSDGDIGIFYYDGEAYIKQLCIDGKKAYLHSINPAYPDMPITEDVDFRIIGEVVERYGER